MVSSGRTHRHHPHVEEDELPEPGGEREPAEEDEEDEVAVEEVPAQDEKTASRTYATTDRSRPRAHAGR
jgi:hypothetical protein